MYSELNCRLRCSEEENLQHTLHCQPILDTVSDELKVEIQKTNLQHIFGEEEDQLKITKIFIKLLNSREELMNNM